MGAKNGKVSFFPEHVKLLKDAQHDYDKSPRPLLGEGQIDDIEQLLSESITNKTILDITTWKDTLTQESD
ncbi:MAG: YolD-like family protein [Bacillota bacterium]